MAPAAELKNAGRRDSFMEKMSLVLHMLGLRYLWTIQVETPKMQLYVETGVTREAEDIGWVRISQCVRGWTCLVRDKM